MTCLMLMCTRSNMSEWFSGLITSSETSGKRVQPRLRFLSPEGFIFSSAVNLLKLDLVFLALHLHWDHKRTWARAAYGLLNKWGGVSCRNVLWCRQMWHGNHIVHSDTVFSTGWCTVKRGEQMLRIQTLPQMKQCCLSYFTPIKYQQLKTIRMVVELNTKVEPRMRWL